jgi:hypothetical protein
MNYDHLAKLLYVSVLSFLFFGLVDAARSVSFTIYSDVSCFLHYRTATPT